MPQKVKNILLLDDEPSVLLALKLLLQALGFNVAAFEKVPDALEHLRQNRDIQLFMSDLRMPIMSGLEVLAEAKKMRYGLPVVLMSAHVADPERKQAIKLGCFGFLSKPFTVENLSDLIAAVESAS